MKRSLRAAALTALFAPAVLTGCKTNSSETGENPASIALSPVNKTVAPGDTTTLTVTSRNTVGRDAEVRWMSTGGNLEVLENGRMARATFDMPGTYTITSALFIDGREVSRDSTDITVRKIH